MGFDLVVGVAGASQSNKDRAMPAKGGSRSQRVENCARRPRWSGWTLLRIRQDQNAFRDLVKNRRLRPLSKNLDLFDKNQLIRHE